MGNRVGSPLSDDMCGQSCPGTGWDFALNVSDKFDSRLLAKFTGRLDLFLGRQASRSGDDPAQIFFCLAG